MLFPDFIRAHFKKEAMASFISENVQHFGLGAAASLGADQQQCSVELFSGTRFQATLTVPATFFTAKTAEVLRHWHLNTGVNQINLQSRGSAPLGVDPDNSAQREELKRRTREYVNSLTFEPLLLPRLSRDSMAQEYAQRPSRLCPRVSPSTPLSLSLNTLPHARTQQLQP